MRSSSGCQCARGFERNQRVFLGLSLALLLGGCGGGGGSGMSCSPPPQIRSTPPTKAAVGQQYTYVVDAIHECGLLPLICGDYYAIQVPPGTEVYMSPKYMTWIPTADQVNTDVKFRIATVPDYCGNSTTQSWTVHVLSEITPPSVTSVYPADTSINVPLNSAIGVSFSEQINSQTVTTASLLVSSGSGAVAGNVQANGDHLTFTPSGNLPRSSTIAITITTAVEDLAGNALASNYSWSFLTGTAADIKPPSIPANLSAIHIAGSAVNLSWSNSVDDFSVVGYKIYRDAVFLQSVAGNSFADNSSNVDSFYCYQVSAVDTVSNESTKSTQACASTAQPSIVANLGYNVGTVGEKGRTSLGLDQNFKAHISYHDDTSQSLYYATNNGGGWTQSAIDTDVYGYPSLVVDKSNNTHIAYTSNGIYSLKYATNSSGVWVVTTVDANWVGLSPSLAVDPAGRAYISYYDYQNGSLKYATNMAGSWVVNTIDSSYFGGQASSLALDSAGKAHISYYDAANANLKYATNVTGLWSISTIDDAGDVGSSTSLAVDTADKVHIGYLDATNRHLKYATNKSGTWLASIIDTGDAVGTGWQPSLALDAADNIYISYDDWGYGKLKYATNVSGVWKLFVLASTPNGAGASSLKLDPNGRAHISSQQSTDVMYSIY